MIQIHYTFLIIPNECRYLVSLIIDNAKQFYMVIVPQKLSHQVSFQSREVSEVDLIKFHYNHQFALVDDGDLPY